MFLATTALTEFWDAKRELLFLGTWCRPRARRSDWEGASGTTLPSPWKEPGAVARGGEDIAALHEALLAFLTGYLNEAHGAAHGERYWRIVLGPWLLGFTAAVVDHGLHLDRALAGRGGLETLLLDPRDRVTPLDTADFATRIVTDLFQLQLYSELLEARGVPGALRRGPAPAAAPPAPSRAKAAMRSALARAARAILGSERVFSDLYASPSQLLGLMRSVSLTPLGDLVASPPAPADPARRAGLAAFRSPAPYAAAAAALLPRHLPVLFLEGHAGFREEVLSRWPRLPRQLLTSVGWYSNETFKLLAAEATEAGAELVLSQHGGGYGLIEPMFSEAHERRVADRYLTWGWSDAHYPGAALVPLPSPKLLGGPPAARARTGRWLLISVSYPRYPYCWYFANAEAAHRFEDQIEVRARFLRAIGAGARESLRVRPHHADLGWDHRGFLAAEFPGLAFDEDPRPWTDRAGDFDLVVIDHPQTSMLDCFARDTPTFVFWEPALWTTRPEAAEVLDGLRRAGLVFDSPEAAARALPTALADPRSWWTRPEALAARAAFRERYARSSPDWLAQWTRALDAPRVSP
ncbi:MAG: hypothetical protein HYX59_13255 [Elusimicrobia bacterium]|nr:hypothetical protein [Elusimicrobiota bacterium]